MSNPLSFAFFFPGKPLLLGLALGVASNAWASEPISDANVLRWADRCTNFTINGWAFRAPANFLPWLDVFSEPSIWLEFARRGQNPQTFVTMANSALEPEAVKNQLEWTDPIIIEKWSRALVDPEFINAVGVRVLDPDKMVRWMMLPLDERVWKLAWNGLQPETWMAWLAAPGDTRTQAFFTRLTDPATAQGLLAALQNPDNYPGGLLSPMPEPAP